MPLFFILLASLTTFFVGINHFPLRNWDEAWYAEIIKNMASGGHGFLVPFWNGQYYFDKPPLYFWLSLPIVKIFGIGEWQVRLVSVLAAAGATFFVYLIGKKLFDQKTGIFASVVFLTIGQVFVRFSYGNLDALLILLNLAVFYFYLLSSQNKKFVPLTGIVLVLGMLTKGWLLGLFPLVIIFSYEFFVNKRLHKNLFFLLFVSCLFYFWWPILGFREFGKEFINWYIFHPAEDSTLASFSLKSFEYFLRDVGVWIVPLLLGVAWSDRKLLSFAAPAFLFLFGIGFLHERLDWHNLPAYPWVALAIGYSVANIVVLKRSMLIAFCLLLLLQIYIVYRIENIYPDRSRVGAKLGVLAKKLIPRGNTVILDDHDFTSFLFYSNLGKIYTIENHPQKPREWWTLQRTELIDFVKNHPKSWIITKDLNSLPFQFENMQIKENYLGYKFLKLK